MFISKARQVLKDDVAAPLLGRQGWHGEAVFAASCIDGSVARSIRLDASVAIQPLRLCIRLCYQIVAARSDIDIERLQRPAITILFRP